MPQKRISKIFLIVSMIVIALLFTVSVRADACVPSNGTSCYTYDDLNRLKRVDYPDGSYISYDYDKLGNITAKEVHANTHVLTIQKNGSGSGAVSSSPAGINCGTDCSESYASGASITLTATPSAGSVFAGWSGGGCGGTGTCVVTTTSAATVTATFNATLTSSYGPWQSAICSYDDDPWSCWDSGLDTCDGSEEGAYTCPSGTSKTCNDVANYVYYDDLSDEWDYRTVTCGLGSHTLTVLKSGMGSGSVTSSPAGINCGTDCTEAYVTGTLVTLTASAPIGSAFAGWSGGGCSGTGSCVVTMNAGAAVTATFNQAAPQTNTYGPWQTSWCNVNHSSSSCWNTGIDTCNGDDWNAYTCPSGTTKTCRDVAYYEYYYYDDDYYYEDASWNYRTVYCVSGQ